MIYSGEIIFWNNNLGFIKYDNLDESIFFHKNNLNKSYKKVSLLDKVQFERGETVKGIHKGKPFAINVKFTSNGNLREHQRTIGKLRNWNSKYGFLDSPQLDKDVFLFHTRLLSTNYKIQEGSYFTFSPIKSSKNPNQLFAFFAYPLEKETDLEFLRQQKNENNISDIEKIISSLIRSQTDISIEEKFKLELQDVFKENTQNSYNQFIELINYYKSNLDFTPSFGIIFEEVPKVYQIQLWENDVIADFDLVTMIDYFHNSTADTKRIIINKFKREDKLTILNAHFKLLIEKGRISKANNDIKILLDIVYRNKESRELEIYKSVKKHILKKLTPKECATLWFNNYIDDLPENYIVNNFDINNVPKLKKENEKHQKIIFKIFENYLINFANEKNFEEDHIELIQYLKVFKGRFATKFDKLVKITVFQLSKIQKLILWVFEPSLPFDGINILKRSWSELDVYFLLKLSISEAIDLDEILLKKISDSITQQKLIDFSTSYNWNALILPVNKPDEDSCLNDINSFIDKFDRFDINVEEIANSIYDSIPLFTIHHLRLWLWGYVADSRFDFVGFREKFKELTSSEQSFFREKGNNQIKEEIERGESLEVVPCMNIISREKNSKIYKAFVENIYFKQGVILLRMENKKYTKPFSVSMASTGLNRIPKSSYYNKFPFTIKVEENSTIKDVKGFEGFFAEIHTGEINKALGRITSPKSSKKNRNKSYIEDWKLRKKVIDYLNKSQFDNEPKLVNTPKSRYRRLDVGVAIDFFEKTYLYSIRTDDGYGIIWENIDLSKDRATFIFKSTEENHQIQLEKIANLIVSSGQFRSTLIRLKKDEEDIQLQVFKNNLGYIAKIHKQRGKNQSFSNWQSKLEKGLLKPIPELPTEEQIRDLKDWQIEMPYSPKTRKVVTKIDEKFIKTKDINLGDTNVPQFTKRPQLTLNTKKSILEKLKEINQIIQKQ